MVDNRIDFTLKSDTIKSLELFSEILKKSIGEMVEEAIDEYLVNIQKQMLEKNISDENAMTNLDYDEFWDGVEL